MANQTYNVVKLHFLAPLHLSRGQTDAYDNSEDVLHSDTLKSAIFVAAKMLYSDQADESFFDGFTVSSAFPFEEEEYFFPKPMIKLNLDFASLEKSDISKKSKKLKKLAYISHKHFEKIIAGKELMIEEDQLSKNGKFIFTKSLDEKQKVIYSSEVQQRLAMPVGDEKDSTPYYVERIYFSENCGLYFFIDYGGDEEIKQKLEAAIKLLGDEGIGTDKHIGNGIFKPELNELSINLPSNANSQILLSLYCPLEEELSEDDLNHSAFLLIKRGGYIASPENLDFLTFRKKSVYMFSEASVFPKEMKITGKKVNLKPENIKGLNHDIWRDGTAFVIPLKQNENA